MQVGIDYFAVLRKRWIVVKALALYVLREWWKFY